MISTDGRKTTYRRRHTAFRRAAALVFAFSMLVTSVLTSWPQDIGVFDLLSLVDESVKEDMIPETVEAADWSSGETFYLRPMTTEQIDARIGRYWRETYYNNYGGSFNWNTLRMIIESWGRQADGSINQNQKPLTIVIGDIMNATSFDPLVRNQIRIRKGQKIRLIGATSPGMPSAIEFSRLGGQNFGAAFLVEDGAELSLGEKLVFTGSMRDQTTETVWVEQSTAGSFQVPPGAQLSFGGIGNHFRVGGKNYKRDTSVTSGVSVTVGNETPTIQLFSSKDGYNKAITSNTNNLSLFDSNYYYVLAYDTFMGFQVIDLETGAGHDWTRLNTFKTMSFAEKKRFLWTVEEGNNQIKYLKNFDSGKVLTNSGDALDSYIPPSVEWVQKTTYYTHPKRAIGDNNNDGFPGGAFFVQSAGTLTVEGAVFKDIFLPATDITSTASDGTARTVTGKNSAPIVITGGTFNMTGGAIENNQVAYSADDTHIESAGGNDQTNAVTPTFYDVLEEKKTNTGSAGAIIIKGSGAMTLSGGTIGSTTGSGDARLHYARNNLSFGEYNGNKGSAGAIILRDSARLTMTGGAIAGNTGVNNGTILTEDNSTFTMTGGSLIGNFNWNGGAINALGESTVNFGNDSGAMPEIAGNDTMQCGGGIFVGSNNVNLISGNIRDNTAADCGGGVYVRGHNSSAARTLFLYHPTNIFENIATSSGIDIGANRASNINKAQRIEDLQTFGRAWEHISTRNRENNTTSDYLNAGGKNNVDKYTTGSGGGIWLCPAGSVFMGADRGTVVKIGNNTAQVQGDDFMKDNGADGGILFGDGTNDYWRSGWYQDDPVRDGQGYTDNQAGSRHSWNAANQFDIDNFTASRALRLHSTAAPSKEDKKLNIYNNTARRGGGMGADGTIVFTKAEDTEPKEILQGQISLQKTFVGVAEQELRIEVALEKTDGTVVPVGEFPLVKTQTDADLLNNSLQPGESVTFGSDYTISFGVPQKVPGGNLFEASGQWSNDWKLVITEKDANGTPIGTDVMKPELESIRYDRTETYQQGKVTYKTAYFTQNVKNVPNPQIEKYINKVVHHNVIDKDEIFTYDVMARLPKGANTFVIEDELPPELMLVNDSEAEVRNGNGTRVLFSNRYGSRNYGKFDLRKSNDHIGDGTGTVSLTDQQGTSSSGTYDGTFELAPAGRTGGSRVSISNSNNRTKITFTLDRSKTGGSITDADILNLPDDGNERWVQLSFRVKYRPDCYDQARALAEQQIDRQSYADSNTLPAYNGQGEKAAVWRRVDDNGDVLNATPLHAGDANEAKLTIDFGNNARTEASSNTVTVKPSEPQIEKYVNDVVHADLSNFDEPFTYDVIAYVPEGATEVTITDTLIRELEFTGRGGMRVQFSEDHASYASTNFNNVIFNNGGTVGKFDIRTGNNHLGDGTGTVSVTSGNEIKASFDATVTNNNTTGNGRLRIEEVQVNGDWRQRLTLTLTDGDNGNAKEVFDAINRNNARWIHFSFKVRIRPEYYREIANKLASGNLSADSTIGWDVITSDGTVLNGASRTGAGGTPSVINYPSQNHAGEANKASMQVRLSGTAEAKTIESNTVTVKPEMTTLSVTKDWYNTPLSALYFDGDYVRDDAQGRAFIKAFAESFTLHNENTAFQNNGVVADALLGAGTDYKIDTITRLNGTAGQENDARHWVITYKKTGTASGADMSPVTLTITTSNGVDNLQGGGTRSSWNLKWENLPKLTNGSWRVSETQLPGDFEAPVYSGVDPQSQQALNYALTGDRIRNKHKNNETTDVYVEKNWVNAEGLTKDWISVVLFARFKGNNGNEIVLAIDAAGQTGNNTAGTQGRADWETYGQYFPSTIRKQSALDQGNGDGRGWMRIGPHATNADLNWKGYWTGLPMYLDGDESRPITYEVREGSLNGWPSGNPGGTFYREGGEENNYNDFLFTDRNGDYTYYITGGKTTAANAATGQTETVYNYTLTNEKATVEKYVNQVVHAELPSFGEEFTYDILAYIPHDATNAVITDTLPEALEFVDDGHRTLYTYNEATGQRDTNINTQFVKNNVLFSAHGNGVAKYDLIENNNHIGNGTGGSVGGTDTGSVKSFQVQHINAGAGLSIEAADPNAAQKLTFEINSGSNPTVWNTAVTKDVRWVHLRFKVRIRPEYVHRLIRRLGQSATQWQTGTDEKIGWAIVRSDNNAVTAEREMVDGDGKVKNGLMQSFGGAYLSYGSAHAGLGNYASLQVSNQPEATSNTVTVTPKVTELTVNKYWRGIGTPDEIGYYNYQVQNNNLLSTNVPYGTDPEGTRGEAFMEAFANSFLLSADPVTKTTSYTDYFAGWERQRPVREKEYVANGGTAYNGSARGSGVGERKPWYVTWKNTAGETHPTVLVIITDPAKGDYLGTGSNDTYRWKLIWYNLPENGTAYHVTERAMASQGFDTPVHSTAAGANGEAYALNGGNIRNTKLNAERIHVDVHKEWVNITPGTATTTNVVLGLVAQKGDGTVIGADDLTFTAGNGGQPFDIGNITLTSANGWEGGWPVLPKYFRNDPAKSAENLITYTVKEISYTQDGQTVAAGSGYNWRVRDNATGNIINSNGSVNSANITKAAADTTGFDYTLINERPAVEKYVNQAVHAELSSFDKEFTYDIMAYIPEGYGTAVIEDELPAALEFVDRNHQSLYTYNPADNSHAQNTTFSKANVLFKPSDGVYGFMNTWKTNDHDGSGAGYVSDAAIASRITNGDKLLDVNIGNNNIEISAADGRAKQKLKITLRQSHGNLITNTKNNHGAWVHVRFKARIRPEYYLQIASRLSKSHTLWGGTTDESLGWAVVSENGKQWGEGGTIDGDGAIVNAKKQTSAGAYVSFGNVHAGEGNYATLTVDNAPAIYSNTVTVVPQTTQLAIEKRWVGDTAADRFTAPNGHILLNSAGTGNHTAYVKKIAENFVVSTTDVPDITLYGTTWTMKDPVRMDRNGLGGTMKQWRVQWSDGTNDSPVTLYITTDNTATTYEDGNTGVTWSFRWEGLPVLEGGRTWSVAEKTPFTYTSVDGTHTVTYDTPVHREADGTETQDAIEAGGSVTNIRIHDDVTRIAVNKQWNNVEISGDNSGGAEPDTYVEVTLKAEYTKPGSTVKTVITDLAADAFFAAKGVSGTLKLLPEENWEGVFEGLPRYYEGHLSQEIAYSVEEKRVVDDGTEVTGFTARVEQNAAGDGFTIVNEKEVIEKYVNSAVHAVLPGVNEVFTYDLMVFIPKDATQVTITDALPATLEYVDAADRTLYAYNATTGERADAPDTAFNTGNSVIRSAREIGEKTGRIDLWSVFDHDGSGSGHVGNLSLHEADAGGMKGSMALRDGAVQVSAAGKDGAQTLTITLDQTNADDAAVFNFLNTYETRWMQVQIRARIRPEKFREVVSRVSEPHETWKGTTDESLGWAIVSGLDAVRYGEEINGDGTVINAGLQNASGTYAPAGDVHAGLRNHASLQINSRAKIDSNTVTVVPSTLQITVDKHWTGDDAAGRPAKDAWRKSLTLQSKLTSGGQARIYSLNADTMIEARDAQNNVIPDTWTGQDPVSGVTVTLTILDTGDPDRWEAVWSGLPRLNDTHYYTMTEDADKLKGYTAGYDNSDTSLPENIRQQLGADEAASDGDITNAQTTVSIPVVKYWRDTEEGTRPDAVTLLVTGTATYTIDPETYEHTITRTVTLTPGAAGWNNNGTAEMTITGLPKYFYLQGTNTFYEYHYTVREMAVSGYLPTDKDGNVLTGSDLEIRPVADPADDSVKTATLYNTEETRVKFTKVWRDGNNAEGARPSSIRVTLCGYDASGTKVYNLTDTPVTVTAGTDSSWSYVFTGLPKYCADSADADNAPDVIVYKVKEDRTTIPSWYRMVDEGEVTATDAPGSTELTAGITNEELTDLTLTKIWHAVQQPDSVTFDLYATTNVTDGEGTTTITYYLPSYDDVADKWTVAETTAGQKAQVTVTGADSWTKTITGLSKYAPDGNRLTYWAKEASVAKQGHANAVFTDGKATIDGVTYTVSLSGTGAQALVNGAASFTNTAETSLSLTKTWVSSDPSDTHPDTLQVKVTGTAPGEGGRVLTAFPETTYTIHKPNATLTQPAAATDIVADDAGNGVWSFTIPGLKTHHTNGEKITYTVAEVVPDGYRATPESDSRTPADSNAVIALENRRVAVTRISAEKIWSPLPADPGTNAGVTVQLVATVKDGDTAVGTVKAATTDYTGFEVISDWKKTISYNAGGMTCEWDNLPRTVRKTGETKELSVSYSVEEINIPQAVTDAGYKVTYEEDAAANRVTIINAKPGIEKYVNRRRDVGAPARENPETGGVTEYTGDDGGVHTDLEAFNEVFTYDVQAYVTMDATRVVITDTLNEAVMLVNAYGAAAPEGTLTSEIHVAAKSGHADGTAPELSEKTDYVTEGGWGLPAGAITKTMSVSEKNGKEYQLLTVEIDLTSDAFENDAERDALRGKWVQITFNARIKDSYLTPEALIGVKGDVLSNTAGDESLRAFGYETVTLAEDEPVDAPKMNRLNTDQVPYRMEFRLVDYDDTNDIEDNHTGAVNRAYYKVFVPNVADAFYEQPSNKVTVDPPLTSVDITKEWVSSASLELEGDGSDAALHAQRQQAVQNFLGQFKVLRSDGDTATDPYLWPLQAGLTAVPTAAPADPATVHYVWSEPVWNGASDKQNWTVTLEKYVYNTTVGAWEKDSANDKPRSVVLWLDPSAAGKTPAATAAVSETWMLTFSGLPLVTGLNYYVTETGGTAGYQAPYYQNGSVTSVTGAFDGGTVVNTQETELTVTKAWERTENGSTVTSAPANVKSVTLALAATYEYKDSTTTPATPHTVVITKNTVTDNGTEVATPSTEQLAIQAKLQTELKPGTGNSWTVTVTGLPTRIEAGGTYAEIRYSAQETAVTMDDDSTSLVKNGRVVIGQSFYEPQYTPANGANGASAALTVTNKEEAPETVSVTAKKDWVPSSAPTGATVTFTLSASYEDTAGTSHPLITNPAAGETKAAVFGTTDTAPHTLDGVTETTAWETTWTGLPKYIIAGTQSLPIEYTVTESTTASNYIGSSSSVTDTDGNVNVTVTNTQDKTSLTLTKAWQNAAGTAAEPSLAFGATDAEVKAYVEAFAKNLALYDSSDLTTDLLAARSTDPVVTGPAAGETAWKAVWSDGTDSITLKLDPGAAAVSPSETFWSATSWTLTFENLPYNGGATYVVKEKAALRDYLDAAYDNSAHADATVQGNTAQAYADGQIINRRQDDTKISAVITKNWEDEGNLDGTRPEKAVFHLYATTLAATDAGYEDSFTLVRVNGTGAPEVTTYTEENYENDTLGAYAKADFDLEVTTGGSGNSFSKTVGNLPQYDLTAPGAQKAYTYRLREVFVPAGYRIVSSASGPADLTATDASGTPAAISFDRVTNKHEPVTTEVPVKKTWVDGYAADFNRTGQITLKLIAKKNDGTEVPKLSQRVTLGKGDVTVDPANKAVWSYTFTNLPAVYQGEEITYTVEEVTPDGYESAVTAPVKSVRGSNVTYSEAEITNTRLVDLSVKKKWEDQGYAGRPTDEELKAALTLYVRDTASGTKTAVDAALIPAGQPVVSGSDAANRVITWSGLPSPGEGKQYVVVENETAFRAKGYFAPAYPAGQDYALTNETAASAETITNKRYDDGSVDLKLTKNWSDETNRDGIRPKEATFVLAAGIKGSSADNADFYLVNVTDPAQPSVAWNYANDTGDTLADYFENMSDEAKAKYHITVKKDDADTLNRAADWTYEQIKNLPKYAFVNGVQKEYTYRLTEVNVADGYSVTQPSDVTVTDATASPVTFTATNSHTPGETEIKVRKVWVGDENNAYNTRKEVTLQLDGVVDGTAVDSLLKTVTLPEDGNLKDNGDWEYTFTGLPQYYEGKQIKWKVTETTDLTTPATGYTVSVSPAEVDGTTAASHNVTITNTINSPDTTVIRFTKTWADTNIGGIDYSAGRRENLKLTLTQSTNDTDWDTVPGNPQPEVTKNPDGTWLYIWSDLPKKTLGNLDITYRVEEQPVTGYTATDTASGAAATSVKYEIKNDITTGGLTNTLDVTQIALTKEWSHGQSDPAKRPTEITVTVTGTHSGGLPVPGATLTYRIGPDLTDNAAVNPRTLKAVADANGDWTVSIPDLPKYYGGNPITWTVTEREVEGYETSYAPADGKVDATAASPQITITNTKDVLKIEGTKTWKDGNNARTEFPMAIRVTVIGETDSSDNYRKTYTYLVVDENYTPTEAEKAGVDGVVRSKHAATGDAIWKFEILDLPAKSPGGKEISYTVKEEKLPFYDVEETNRNGDRTQGVATIYDVTNTYNERTIRISGRKNWQYELQAGPPAWTRMTIHAKVTDAAGNASAANLDASVWNNGEHGIKVYATEQLKNDDTDTTYGPDDRYVWEKDTETGIWFFKINGSSPLQLPEYDKDGKQITYTVTENAVASTQAAGGQSAGTQALNSNEPLDPVTNPFRFRIERDDASAEEPSAEGPSDEAGGRADATDAEEDGDGEEERTAVEGTLLWYHGTAEETQRPEEIELLLTAMLGGEEHFRRVVKISPAFAEEDRTETEIPAEKEENGDWIYRIDDLEKTFEGTELYYLMETMEPATYEKTMEGFRLTTDEEGRDVIAYASALTFTEPEEEETAAAEEEEGTEEAPAEEEPAETPAPDDASTGNGSTDGVEGAAGSGRTDKSDNTGESGNASSGSGASSANEDNPDASGTGAAGEGSGASSGTDAGTAGTQEEVPATDESAVQESEVLGAFVQDISIGGEITFEGTGAEDREETEVLIRVKGMADGADVYDEIFTVTPAVTEREDHTIPADDRTQEDIWTFEIEGLHVLDENDTRISYSVQQILSEETTLRKISEQMTVEPVDAENHQMLRYTSVNLRTTQALKAGDRGYIDKTGNVALTVERVWPDDVTTTDPLAPSRKYITLDLMETFEGTETAIASYVISPDGTLQKITSGTAGTLTETKKVTDADRNVLAWIFDVTNLPAERDGKPLSYRLVETETETGEKVVNSEGTTGSGYYYTYAVTDVVTKQVPPEKIRLDVEKIWQDKEGTAVTNSREILHQSVTVHLTQNGQRTGDTLTLSATNSWRGSFTDLDDSYYDTVSGQKHSYTYGIEEDRLPGYEPPQINVSGPDTNGNYSATVTNKERGETREIRVQKKFTGGTEAELAEAKKTEIVFTLYRGNDPWPNSHTPMRVTRPANAPDTWEGKFTGLPVYVPGTDTEIDYRVVETTEVKGYTASAPEVSGTNASRLFTFTNKRTETPETVEVAARKTFKDASGKVITPPSEVASITVYLTENGTRSSKMLQMTPANNFTVRFENLPKLDSKGKEIAYGVQEGWILDKNGKNLGEGYTASVALINGAAKKTDADYEYEITNQVKPPEEERLIKTVNGEREYKLRASDEEIVYEIKGIVPDHAVRMEIRDQMPDVLVTRVVKVFINGTEHTKNVSTTVRDNLVTVHFENAQELVGKEMLVRIEARFKDGADVSGYANYYVDNTAEWFINGEVFGESRAASIDSEILVVRHNDSAALKARRSKTGDPTDTIVFQLRLMAAVMALLFLATLNPRKKKTGD